MAKDKRIGNQFWKLRAKHGRDAIFTDPNKLLESAYEYFNYIDENPDYKTELYENSNGTTSTKSTPLRKPYTLIGLCLYLGVNSQYFKDFKKTDVGKTKDFSLVITHIEETIYNQKFEGASIGVFNHNIIARDLGLIDKTLNENTNKNIELNLTDEEIQKELKRLRGNKE